MKRQTKVQTFITTATPEEWDKLSAHIKAATKKRESLPAPELGFDFSYSAIAPLLEERGLLERRHKTASDTIMKATTNIPAHSITSATQATGFPPFTVTGSAPTEKISRSVQLDKDVSDRLHKLEDDCWQYTHSAVLNQIIRDGLSKYGY